MTLAAAVLVAGCGGGDHRAPRRQSGPPRPPPIVLDAAAGSQRAVQGSSCVDTRRVGVCADTGYPAPAQLSVVRPGESVRVRLRGATGGIDVDVHRLGCHAQTLRRITLARDGRWRVQLAPGAYELFVFGRFATSAISGDTSGGLGLWVSATRPPRILPAGAIRTLCPPS